ncbi:MAG: glutamine--tRNA ligase/YqeY domain fusion protein [Gemmatimonadetes bacterium]|nr:glutamine--tRNA ligase/YqeY domain fusion protein [Gemmatimonadota bacterium]
MGVLARARAARGEPKDGWTPPGHPGAEGCSGPLQSSGGCCYVGPAAAHRGRRRPDATPLRTCHHTVSDTSSGTAAEPRAPGRDFIRQTIDRDLESGRWDRVVTRFPPEPNGFLHIGHAKAVCLSFGIAEEYGGRCHLRYDDTNPETEEDVYVRAIAADVRWLGFDWGGHRYFASDYFERMYACAELLVEKGSAYVDSSSEEEIREMRGTLTEPGRESPFRDRPVEENLDLLRRMKAGEFPDGAHVLRAKIDMASPNMVMRDPVLYRIRHATHHRTGDEWCIYPLYDYAHCLEDAFEGITHSLCTLEFVPNRAIYDWVLDEVGFEEPRTHQYEFNRLHLEYTVLSKRKLIRLVREGHVDGWDDPRMPTLTGLRRRGVPPGAVRAFCGSLGVTKSDSRVDVAKLEHAIREELNQEAPRVMGVLRPLPLTVTTWPEGEVDWIDAPSYPKDVGREGSRRIPFDGKLLVERDDFREDPPKGWYRLAPGREVRLRYGYFVTVDEVVRDPETGEVAELRCSHDPATRGGDAPDGRSPKGTIHWVSAAHALDAEVRLYDRLFSVPDPDDVPEGEDFTYHLNPGSRIVLEGAKVEPSLGQAPPDTRWQLERTGYFWRDPEEGRGERLVLNRIVSLRDAWARREAAEDARGGATDHPEPVGGSPTAHTEPPPEQRPGAGPETRVSDARERARSADPELARRRARYLDAMGLDADAAGILSGDRALSDFFEAAVEAHDAPGSVASWVVNDVLRELGERDPGDLPFGGAALGRLVRLVDEDRVTRALARQVLAEMAAEGGDPDAIVERRGLTKVSDPDALEPHVERALAERPDKVEEYRAGKTGLLGFFVGQVMRATGGTADPKLVAALMRERLEGDG